LPAISLETDLVTPLRKTNLEGAVYERDARIEAILRNLESLPRADLVARCQISNRSDPGYVPSECLLYFLRATRDHNGDAYFERLYKLLIARLLRVLPRAQTAKGIDQTRSLIREAAVDRFVGLLVADRRDYSDKLDFFEIRFDRAVANLRRDAQERAWREANRTMPIAFDPETNEPSAAVEAACGSFNPFDASFYNQEDYRSRLDAAIDTLAREQIRIIEMLRQGIPIDSKEPGTVTIARTLGKSERTVRNHRDRAFAALRAALAREPQQ
jgi:DNA-directed RNA polymerase specialized sigma24 family protein